ncbi:MAG TPA: oligosaccharide flippase family protein [Solirubrobacteraceae bacterium]|jgi:O-antigen/teichoic acid export membrane protein|nr:oligosaccharide flippase family protein [Solirubrobacteraceae bacterium]
MSVKTLEFADRAIETAAPEQVREATLAGVRWGVVARVGIETATFLSSVALARLVSPVGFGRAAVALAVVSLATALAIEGFGTPLVQRKLMYSSHVEVALLLSICTGLVLTMLCVALTFPLAAALGGQTAALIRLAAPAFLIVSFGVIPQALAQRQLNFRITSLVDLGSLVVGVALSLALAAIGLGGKALVIGQLAIPLTAAIIYLLVMPRTRPRWHPFQAREITGFGIQTTASTLLYAGYQNLDYVIVGATLGARATGFYWRAFQIGGVYQGKISQIMLRLALPVYSRTQDLNDMRHVRGRIVRVHATAIFPLLAVYVAVAPALVPLVFGARWAPTVVPSQILAFAGMTFALGTGTAALVLAAGKPRALLYNSIVSIVLYAGVVVAFARYGLTTLCVAIVVLNTLGYLGTYYVLMHRIVGIRMRQLWSEVAPATLSMVPLFATAVPVYHLLVGIGAPTLVKVAAPAAVGGIAYLATLRFGFKGAWTDLELLARRVVNR